MKDVPKAIEAVWKVESTRLIGAIAQVTHDIGVAEGHTDFPSFQLRELALPLPLPTAHYQLLGLLLSRSDLTLFGLSWLSGH